MEFNDKEITYEPVLKLSMEFAVMLKTLLTKGNLVYEYNPLRNYRVTEPRYIYKNRLYTPKELLIELGVVNEHASDANCLSIIEGYNKEWPKGLIPEIETDPVLVEPGELTDFETNELSFDLSHPVNILPLYSYDNSVNLIINDGKNKPRLINSRFSALDRNKYQIVDRKGDNDTNIYDSGSQFDIDTSLYKRVTSIPKLRLVDISEGGRLSVGNYHFYFRYADADGNETDFVAESGLVSLFIGNVPTSIRSGFRNEDSHKLVRFQLENIDSSYQYVNVYYTKSTSDIYENSTTAAFRIDLKFLVNNMLKCDINITGYENVTEITLEEINPFYQIADSVETQVACLNRLFLGNIRRPNIPYKDLEDISLRFRPRIYSEDYPLEMDLDYNISSYSYGYYDPKFIYKKVGYWNHEIYRFGVVYIMSDGTLSPVFNVRGILNLSENSQYSNIRFYLKEGSKDRNYIIYEEDTYKIIQENEVSYSHKKPSSGVTKEELKSVVENAKGVVSIDMPATDKQLIYSINFEIENDVIDYLKNTLKIKGLFFVRLKRIPTILCLAYTIGIDKESNTPILPTGSKTYVAERFINDDLLLTNDIDSRIYTFQDNSKVRKEGAICPEYDVDTSFLNALFSGDSLVITESDILPVNPYLLRNKRNFYIDNTVASNDKNLYNVNILGIEDNMKVGAINDSLFSARAGEAEEAFRYEYLEKLNKITKATNLIRGSFGPYLGITGYNLAGKMIDIRIPGFNKMTQEDLFKIRYSDKSSFYAISERIDINSDDWTRKEDLPTKKSITVLYNQLYRGDCYICQFTHRLNRNFQSPSAPINDKIVDPKCWKENYEISDGVLKTENFEKINLGDVNAIKLGMWVTLTVRSTKNLNVRTLDESLPDEVALTGHPRGFCPYQPINADGSYKIPEALCYNKGFERSVSERYNYEVPDVPTIKNDFTNRILYSDVAVNDAFKNGFRVFLGTHYRDYPKTYGSIIKLIELSGNIVCIFEHGVALIPVNERTVAGESDGGNVYINTNNVLPLNPKILSDTYGSQWRESVIKTETAIYGVDTIGKKIWRTNGLTFECISDFSVLLFLNENISLTERELEPIIGIRNVKTHYNKLKGDVMFTFYDNLHGFEEKIWNLCWNENLNKWITFYSWIPSYSENIYNSLFSFDRNTSKWITKLGISRHNCDFADGITVDNPVISPEHRTFKLYLDNRLDSSKYKVRYELVRDNYSNYKLFTEPKPTNELVNGLQVWEFSLRDDIKYEDLCSEYYARVYEDCYLDDLSVDAEGNEVMTAPLIEKPEIRKELSKGLRTIWKENLGKLKIYKDDNNKRINLSTKDKDNRVNGDKVVIYLNILAHLSEKDTELNLGSNADISAGYYLSTITLIPKYNMLFLSTDFWKHGLAGIIDIADKVYPTYWYGKLHPFEFEFIVADKPDSHKIFDNLEIISNKAAPESFHYEIVGECYEFAKDKKNMYIRLEATKELLQYNGSDITYDHNYKNLKSVRRPLTPYTYEKSTIFPLYYYRKDTINEIEDLYHLYKENTKDFSALSGSEIVRYDNLNEYRIWNHSKAVDITKAGLIRGNMYYKEDKWNIQINPLNFVLRNETLNEWRNAFKLNPDDENTYDLIPAELNLLRDASVIPTNRGELMKLELPEKWTRNIVSWSNYEQINKLAKMKDKYIKIRIRYNGEDLAIISAIKTLYSISYA